MTKVTDTSVDTRVISHAGSAGGQAVDPAPIATVIIPAHNEQAVIARLLDALNEGLDSQILDIVVVCNGCSDRTEEVCNARAVRVIKIPQASKIDALNAGDLAALPGLPRFFVDADVVLTGKAVLDVASELGSQGVLCAAPPPTFETSGRRWIIRAFYDFWTAIPWFADAPVGTGVYAISPIGRDRFDRFPPVIADDLFARNLFYRNERRVVNTDPFVVQVPRTLRALVHQRTRAYAGNMELAAHPTLSRLPGAREHTERWWRVLIADPRLLVKAVPYVIINSLCKVKARQLIRGRHAVPWGRDETTRTAS